ncbi:TonB-dependent receptor plug domain-containing protein [Bacterioplanes sanyensis]|nr:TonB-dependent receptor [Bacterioplanes sanyensis]
MRWLLLLLFSAQPAVADTYTADDFAAHLPETLLDMLQLLPGVSISGDADQRRIQVSGTPSGQTRLLIDGVALPDRDGSGQSLAASIPAAAVASIELDADNPDPLGLGSAIIRVQLHNASSTSPGGELRVRLTGSQDGAAALRWNSRQQQWQLMHSGSRFDDQQSLFSGQQQWQWSNHDIDAQWLWIAAEQNNPDASPVDTDSARLQLNSRHSWPSIGARNRLTISQFEQDFSPLQQHTQQWQWLATLEGLQGEHRWQIQTELQHEQRRQSRGSRYRLDEDSFGLTLRDRWQLNPDLHMTLGYRMQSYQQRLRRSGPMALKERNTDTHWLPFVHLHYQYDDRNQLHWQLSQHSQLPSSEQRLSVDGALVGNPQLQAEILNRMQLSWRHESLDNDIWQLRWIRQTWHNSLVAQALTDNSVQLINSDEVQQLHGYEVQWQGDQYLFQQPWRTTASIGLYRWRGRESRTQPRTISAEFAQARFALVHIVSAQLRWAMDWQWQSRSQDYSSLLPDTPAPAGYRSALNLSWLPLNQWHLNARLGYHRPGLMTQTYNRVGQWDWHAGVRYRW